jgi:hypothetical protein
MSTGKAQKGLLLPLIHPYSRARRDMNVLIAVCLLYIAVRNVARVGLESGLDDARSMDSGEYTRL